jgi:hypothetical protein
MFGQQVPGIEQTVESFAHMLRAHGVHRASFVGHSFGSICVSWMVKHRPHLVTARAGLPDLALYSCLCHG